MSYSVLVFLFSRPMTLFKVVSFLFLPCSEVVMGDRLNFIIDHRLESVDAFDAILPIIIGSHILTKVLFKPWKVIQGHMVFTQSLYSFMCKGS